MQDMFTVTTSPSARPAGVEPSNPSRHMQFVASPASAARFRERASIPAKSYISPCARFPGRWPSSWRAPLPAFSVRRRPCHAGTNVIAHSLRIERRANRSFLRRQSSPVPASFHPRSAPSLPALSLAGASRPAAPRKPTVTTSTQPKTPRIAALLARTDSITLSDRTRRHSVSPRISASLRYPFSPCLRQLRICRAVHTGNAPAATSLRTSVSALNCLRGHLATSS